MIATAITWQGFAASAIGKAHIDSGLPNQDAIFLQHEPDYTVAVVGMGQAPHALANKARSILAKPWASCC